MVELGYTVVTEVSKSLIDDRIYPPSEEYFQGLKDRGQKDYDEFAQINADKVKDGLIFFDRGALLEFPPFYDAYTHELMVLNESELNALNTTQLYHPVLFLSKLIKEKYKQDEHRFESFELAEKIQDGYFNHYGPEKHEHYTIFEIDGNLEIDERIKIILNELRPKEKGSLTPSGL